MPTNITSKQWRLDAYDFGKALIVAACSQPVTIILTSLSAGQFNINWKAMGIMAVGSAASYLLKNLFTPSQTVTTPAKVWIFLICMVAGLTGHSQSLFGPLHKPQPKSSFGPHAAGAIIGPFDSVAAGQSYVGFRFQGPTVMYGTSFKDLKQSTLFTFMWLSYQKATFDASAQKYYTNWAFAIGGGAGGQFAPNTVSGVTAIGANFSTQKLGNTNLPFLVVLGFIYNLTTKQSMPAAGPGIPLNN